MQKKIVKYLYIDADEDHAHLQLHKKGNLEISESSWKENGIMTKIVYASEDKKWPSETDDVYANTVGRATTKGLLSSRDMASLAEMKR